MAGISNNAFKDKYHQNKYRFQKQELQSHEFGDGSGLEMYEFKYRMDDPQVGKFWSVDHLSTKYEYNSPYAFSENRVINGVELEGLEWSPASIGIAQGFRDLGISSSSDAKQLSKNVGKELLNPKTWAEGYAGVGPLAGAALIGIFTGGIGSTAALPAEGGVFVSMEETPTIESLNLRAGQIYSAPPIVEGAEDASITLYRGVNESHAGYSDALKGVARPRGGNATPLEHNMGNTQSPYTSWSQDIDVALNYAIRPNGGNGVIMEITVPVKSTVPSPNLKTVQLKQDPTRIVTEREVLMEGAIYGTKINPITWPKR